ncbi:MAG TPA: hypothetical protein VG937_13955 [Polyangiaceae bacterium]|nr:hypothetical protein [Polyangiaceae bacterium]
MKRTASLSLRMTAAVLVVSCVTTPTSQTVVDADRDLAFSGVYPYNRREAGSVQMWGWDGSAWLPLGSPASVGSDNRWRTASLRIPVGYWQGPCRAARFRATNAEGTVVPTLNQTCLDALGPSAPPLDSLTCLSNEVVLYGVANLPSYAPPGGSLNIASQGDADWYRCISQLDGNLFLDGGSRPAGTGVFQPGLEISLPHLASVTGNLEVWTNHAQRIGLPALASVRGDLTLRQNVFRLSSPTAGTPVNGRIELPVLTSVGTASSGTLSLLSVNLDAGSLGASQWTHDFALGAVTSAHSVVASNAANSSPNRVFGLNGLSEVSGDVTVASPAWELYDVGQLLGGLARIRGSLVVTTGNHLNGALRSLSRVDGDVSIVGTRRCQVNVEGPSSGILPLLADVGGNLTIRNCDGWRCDRRVLPALHTVAGALVFAEGIGGFSSLEMGARALSVGSLTIDNTTTAGIFRHDVLSVRSGGTIRVVDNPSLCECRIDEFLALQAPGWSGTVERARNRACAPCPAEPACASAPP